jgi:predicted XRE-type DNA-binding protein
MCEFEKSSGNIYKDLGFSDCDEMLTKAKLVTIIMDLIESKGLTKSQAAETLELSKSKLSRITNGNFQDVSASKLLEAIIRLGRDVQVIILPEKMTTEQKVLGRMEVIS